MIEIDAMFPLMVTNNLEAVKQFYETIFGFKAVFYQDDFYLHLVSPNNIQLGFLIPAHASQPEFLQQVMSPNGFNISLEVKDAALAYAEAQKLQLDFAMNLKTEEWGQVHFMVKDPAGLYLDIIEHTKPEYSLEP
jgi:uncharacterized glyoxalase superfamily protein PhnB